MSELKSLINAKVSELNNQKIFLSERKCAEADKLLCDAKTMKSPDKSLILKAIDLYQEAVELYSANTKAYLGLAFIFYSSGELKTALGFLNKAQEKDEFNPKVIELVKLLRSELKKEKQASAVAKVAGKSLSDKMASKNSVKTGNLIENLLGLVIKSSKSTKIKPKQDVEDFSSLLKDVSKTMDVSRSKAGKETFFTNLNRAKSSGGTK